MNKIKIIIFHFLFFIMALTQNQNFSIASTQIKIVNKINNEIITNFDIENEYNYLIALNNELKNIPKKEALEIAKKSLIREKIKASEIKKYYILKDFNRNEYLANVLKDFYLKLNISTEKEFISYLNTFDLEIEEVKNKIKLEILWNQLIGSKFKNQINIDETFLKKKMVQNNLNFKNIVEYDLSEIVFQAKTQDELNSTINEIKLSIEQIGFNNTANKYSISDSAKFAGKIGKVKENQLSEVIKTELKSLKIGQISKPLNIGGSFLLLFVNDKKKIQLEQDEEKILENMIEFEKAKQFEQFSQIYFNKIKLNLQIESY